MACFLAKAVEAIVVDFYKISTFGFIYCGLHLYIEDSHPAIIDPDTWEAVQLEKIIRKQYCIEHRIQKLEYATNDNPFAGRIICGNCGCIF